MSKYIKIEGIVEIKDYQDNDLFIDEFITFVEKHNWYFGGGSKEVDEYGENIE